jgi:hypothetical protein
MFIPRPATVFLGIAAEPVKAGYALFCSELSLVSQSISLERSNADNRREATI